MHTQPEMADELSAAEISERPRGLAQTDPELAARILASLTDAIDKVTGGRWSGQSERLERIAYDALAVAPGRLPSGEEDPDTAAEPGESGGPGGVRLA